MKPEEKLERYIKMFKEKHGDRYDYSMVKIDESIRPLYKQKVKVVCQEHGVFDVSIKSHLNKRGCKFCGYKKAGRYRRISAADLIERMRSMHGDRYDYDCSALEMATTRDYVTITCKIHGDFRQKFGNHLSGKGCKKCANESLQKDSSHVRQIAGKLRMRLKKSNCEICGQGDTWNGLPLTLEIDHIDGNKRNNSLENLRTLCPNCHRQQVTTGKSKKKLKEVLMVNPDLNPEAAKSLGVIED